MNEKHLYCRSTNNIPRFIDFINELGGEGQLVLRKVYGRRVETHEKLDFIPWASIIELYEGTSEDLEEPFFGLKWALALPSDFRNGGPQVYFFSIAKNMEHFLKLALNFQKLHNNAISYKYWVDEASETLTASADFHPAATYSRQFIEHVFAVAAQFCFRFIPNFELKRVQFQHSRPEDTSLYQELFKCPVEFNCDKNTLSTHSHFLDLDKTSHVNTVLTPLVKSFVNWRVKKKLKRKATIAMTLAELLPSLLGARQSDMAKISAAMNMNPKKLQRLLKDEGTSYTEVLDNVRQNLAKRLLLETDIPMIRIALLLDYASDKPFIAAFKRWYNDTPARYRKLHKREKPMSWSDR